MSNKSKAADVQAEVNSAAAPLEDAALAAELAPAAGATVPQQDRQRPANRFMALFPEIAFKTVESGRTFDNSDGSKTKRVAAFVAICAGDFAGLNGNIYARLPKGSKTPVAECSFVGTRNSPALVALDESAKAEMTEYRRYVAMEYAKWRNGQPTTVKISKVAVELTGADDLFADA